MIGSRFDLAETLNSIAAARAASGDQDLPAEVAAVEAAPSHRVIAVDEVVADVFEQAKLVSDAGAIETSCADLERELGVMAREVHLRASRIRFNCPVCDSVMDVCAEEHMPEFGALDIQLHRLECTHCGMLTGRAFHPDVGYQALHR